MTTLILLFFLSFLINGLETQESFQCLDVDQQLKILNKPYVKSVKTEEGDIIDCVNIKNQPAFDHPSLKDHIIQMKPSSSVQGIGLATSPSAKLFDIGIKSIGCPTGTVPIKRTPKEDLLRTKMLMKSTMIYTDPTIVKSPGFHYAIKILRSSPSVRYSGAGGILSVQNPVVSNDQFSEAFVGIQSQNDNQIDSIQIGWMVNPTLRGDNRTRSFALWMSGKHGCFDLMCPGFVQVNHNLTIDFYFPQTSVYGGQQIDNSYIVFQDKGSGDWWLQYGDQIMGYWPKSLFSSLSNSVNEIAWGGGVFSAPNEASPPMGSGHFVEEGISKAAYVRYPKIIDESNKPQNPDDKFCQSFSDNPWCYNIGPLKGIGDEGFGILYGGPGGGNCGM